MKLSDGERLIIALLCDIHKHLGIRNSIDPDFVSEVLSTGNLWALRDQYRFVMSDDVVPQSIVDETGEILTMWDQIEAAVSDLSSADQSALAQATSWGTGAIQFPGFDGNNETEHMSVATTYTKRMGRFSYLDGRYLNSHYPTLDSYRRMLDVYRTMRHRVASKDAVEKLLKARLHP